MSSAQLVGAYGTRTGYMATVYTAEWRRQTSYVYCSRWQGRFGG
jgi:hypothetical protein